MIDSGVDARHAREVVGEGGANIIFFIESYIAGGGDKVARILLDRMTATRIDLFVNRRADRRILFGSPLPTNVRVHEYGLVTPMDIGMFANRFRGRRFLFSTLKALDYLARYPLLLVSCLYFYFMLRRYPSACFYAHNGGYPGGLYCGTATMAAALVPGIKKRYLSCHSLPRPMSGAQWPVEWIWDRILDRCCTFICVSKQSAKLLRNTRSIKQAPICISNGLDNAAKKRRRIPNGQVRFLHVGYFDFNKNQAMIVNALYEAVTRGVSNLRVTFIGDVAEPAAKESVLQLVRQNGLQEYVGFLGFQADTVRHYETHDVFLFGSRVESFPLVVLEAMRAGMPVISTDVGGINEQLKNGVNGFLVGVDDAEKMAERMIFYCRNIEHIEAMGEAGRQIFEENFTAARMVKRYEKVFGLTG